MTAPEIAVTRIGAGEPVVLIHGIGHRRQAWDPIIPAVARRRDVIAVDLPGFGESPALPGDMAYDIATTTDSFAKFFADLGLDRPHVVGNSLGGSIAIELGALDLVRSVTAFAPAGFWNPIERRHALGLLRTMRYAAGLPDPMIRGVGNVAWLRSTTMAPVFAHPERVSKESFLADARLMRESPGFAPTAKAGRSYVCDAVPLVPTTIAWGTKDRVLLPRQARRAKEQLPEATHIALPGCGHVPMIDDPKLVAKVILTATRPRR